MTVNHGVPGSSPGEGAKATDVGWLFFVYGFLMSFLCKKALIFCKYPAHVFERKEPIIKKMATLNLVLDKRRKSQDNKFPLVFRIYAGNKSRDLHTGIKIAENQFNSKSGEIVDDYIANNTLQILKVEHLQKLNLCTLKNKGVENAQEVKSYLLGKLSHEYTIYSFWQEQIDFLNSIGRTGTARSYKIVLSSISKQVNLIKPFEKFGYKDLIELETTLYKNGMTINGVSVYLRTLKAIYNKAINLDIVGYDSQIVLLKNEIIITLFYKSIQ